jgi:hypothetical protein
MTDLAVTEKPQRSAAREALHAAHVARPVTQAGSALPEATRQGPACAARRNYT